MALNPCKQGIKGYFRTPKDDDEDEWIFYDMENRSGLSRRRFDHLKQHLWFCNPVYGDDLKKVYAVDRAG